MLRSKHLITWTINTTNISGISEDLICQLVFFKFGILSFLYCFELDIINTYREKGNSYVDNNIQEIQELYRKEEPKKKEGKIKNKEVILIKPYEVFGSTSSSIKSSSFINKKINNLLKYMKFIKSPIQTRIFRLPLYYQSLWSREKQDPNF